MVANKVVDCIRYENREIRGGGKVRAMSAFGAGHDPDVDNSPVLRELISDEPTPDFAAVVAESFQQRLAQLGDDRLQAIAIRKMEGWSNEEIAAELTCVPRTVERKLQLIRKLWTQAPEP